MEERVKKIEQMEKIMNEQEDLLNMLNILLDEFESKQDEFAELIKYYTSDEWFEDNELMQKNKLPKDLACGVLTEDGAYNVIGGNLHTGLRLVEIANRILKDHFNN